MEEIWHTFDQEFDKIKTAKTLEIKKFNKDNQLCYYDSIDFTGKNIEPEMIANILIKAGFKASIKSHQYSGIYDPSRMAELIEIYPTDEELLKKELMYKSIKL